MMVLAPFVALALLWWTFGHSRALSPDGTFYIRLAKGETVPRPYGLRWWGPATLGADPETWASARWLATAFLGGLSWQWAYVHQVDPATFVALVLGLSVVRTSWMFPVLVDLQGLTMMLLVGLSGQTPIWAQLVMGLVAGLVHERAPIMGALLAQSPWGLVGCAVTAFRWRRCSQNVGYRLPPWLARPFSEARKETRLSAEALLLPWGVGIAALLAPSWTGWQLAVVAAAYAPLLVAQDHARIYQWAFPVVLVQALRVLPPEWALAAVVLQWLWPWRRTL